MSESEEESEEENKNEEDAKEEEEEEDGKKTPVQVEKKKKKGKISEFDYVYWSPSFAKWKYENKMDSFINHYKLYKAFFLNDRRMSLKIYLFF